MQSAPRLARDEWLALGCQRGRPEAFAELIREMERPLLYYVTKLLRDDERALDVLQEIWLRAFRSIHRLENPRRLRPWLYRIAHGLAVDRRKWWIDAVRAVLTTLGAVVLLPLAILFGLMVLYLLVGGASLAEAWCPATAGLACLAGAVVLLRWFFRRRADDLLLEVKRLQAQGLQLEEQLRRPEGR
jgi:hypothetical protein